ncbi:MAG TPA: hypothetical protein VLX44_15970, partial [Xanthobacteraceae bacterium]|nr:hypothetical protein [Xanthobacteraceae bacterium]
MPAALGLLLLLACHGTATAAPPREIHDVDAYLPRCKPPHEARVPIATWDINYGKLASLRHLMSGWPSGVPRIIYGSFGVAEDDVRIADQDKGYLVTMTVQGKESEAGEIKITAAESPQFNVGYYNYWGYFEVSLPPSPKGTIALHRLDTFDVVSSARYCLGNGTPQAAPGETPASQTAQSGSLPVCRRLHESRIPIVTWKPKFTTKGYLQSEPPAGNGRIVYISMEGPRSSCYKYDPPWPGDNTPSDELYSLEIPNDPVVLSNGERVPSGGRSVNLRGNRTPVETGCRFDGFYMNEPVFGIH